MRLGHLVGRPVRLLGSLFCILALLCLQFSVPPAVETAMESLSQIESLTIASSKPACLLTISAFNNYGFVSAFLKRVEVLHPEMRYVWAVADNHKPLGWASGPNGPNGKREQLHLQLLRDFPSRWQLATLDQLQPYMPFSYAEIAFRYNMQCFNTAIKPAAIKFMFQKLGCHKVLYVDNDIWIMQPLTAVIAALDRYQFVVTPHVTQPVPLDGYHQDERTIMLAGQFNFGFLAASKSGPTYDILDWWLERLRYYGHAAPWKGEDFDQKWGQYIASFLQQEEYLVLRDPRYNIAYWNLHYRGAHLRMENGTVWYDSQPVVFMHFSGMSDLLKYNLDYISPHQNRYRMSDFPILREIVLKYLIMLNEENATFWRKLPYGFSRFDDGTLIPDVIRNYFSHVLDPGESYRNDVHLFKDLVAYDDPFGDDPFGTQPRQDGKLTLLDWMLQDAHHLIVEQRGPHKVSELAWQIYLGRPDAWKLVSIFLRIRPDLQSLFLDPFGKDRAKLVSWYIEWGVKETSLQPWKRRIRQDAHKTSEPLQGGVNVYGWFHGIFGVAQSSRLLLRALNAVQADTTAIALPADYEHHRMIDLKTSRAAQHRINLFVANADSTPMMLELFPHSQWSIYYNIGYWAWELEKFPREWMVHLRVFNEVWTPSEFVTTSITSSPLYRNFSQQTKIVTMNTGCEEDYLATRPRFDFPTGALVFLVMFDFQSSFHRKNPLAAVEAFKKAFGRSSKRDVLLVIKCLLPSAEGSLDFSAELEELRSAAAAAAAEGDAKEQRSLLASVDVLVSLHRSEGYGLALLEMLMLGKPVIATAYSGNMDFMSWLPESFRFLLIPHGYVQVNTSEHFQRIYTSDQRWADPDVRQAASAMSKLAADRGLLDKCRQVVGPLFREQFGFQKVGNRMKARLEAIDAQLARARAVLQGLCRARIVTSCQRAYQLLRSKLDFPPEDFIFDCLVTPLGSHGIRASPNLLVS
eukprot:s5396_g2.t2